MNLFLEKTIGPKGVRKLKNRLDLLIVVYGISILERVLQTDDIDNIELFMEGQIFDKKILFTPKAKFVCVKQVFINLATRVKCNETFLDIVTIGFIIFKNIGNIVYHLDPIYSVQFDIYGGKPFGITLAKPSNEDWMTYDPTKIYNPQLIDFSSATYNDSCDGANNLENDTMNKINMCHTASQLEYFSFSEFIHLIFSMAQLNCYLDLSSMINYIHDIIKIMYEKKQILHTTSFENLRLLAILLYNIPEFMTEFMANNPELFQLCGELRKYNFINIESDRALQAFTNAQILRADECHKITMLLPYIARNGLVFDHIDSMLMQICNKNFKIIDTIHFKHSLTGHESNLWDQCFNNFAKLIGKGEFARQGLTYYSRNNMQYYIRLGLAQYADGFLSHNVASGKNIIHAFNDKNKIFYAFQKHIQNSSKLYFLCELGVRNLVSDLPTHFVTINFKLILWLHSMIHNNLEYETMGELFVLPRDIIYCIIWYLASHDDKQVNFPYKMQYNVDFIYDLISVPLKLT